MTPHHRPPRVREVVQPTELEVPAPPVEPRPQHRTPLARLLFMTLLPALLPPLGLGLATWALGQSSTVIVTSIALSGSLGAAVVITTLMSRRDEDVRIRAERDDYLARIARWRAEVAALDRRCEELVQRERRLLAEQFPEQPVLDATARARDRRLWETRPGDSDFLEVRLGLGQRRSSIIYKNRSNEGWPAGAPDLDRHLLLESAPVTLALPPGATRGVVGAAPEVSALLRTIAHQVAVRQSPADVRMAVFSRDEAFCGWAKWLPHCRLASSNENLPLVARSGPEAFYACRAISNEIAARGGDTSGPVYVIIADGRAWDSLPERMKAGLTTGARSVCLVVAEELFEQLPGDCDTVMELADRHGKVLRREEPAAPQTFTIDGFDDAAARQSALAMSPLVDAGDGVRSPIPRSARLTNLLGLEDLTPEIIRSRWSKARSAFRLSAPIAAGANDSVVEIDLRKDGPHGLIAGTTGSGKSELLQSLVASFAVRIPPDLVNFVLVDYKGGRAFAEVEGLPHVVGFVSDLDDRMAWLALESLRAERRRREHLLAEAGVNDIIEYQREPRAVPLANLVIIIDEFHRLVSEQPEFIEEMVRITQQGRSFGVHLLLSTQKPSGVITDQIRANTNLRIALRVTDEADSRDVLGSPEAAAIPRDLPGRMYVRVGNEPLRAGQVGRVSGEVPVRIASEAAISARPFLEVRSKRSRRGAVVARVLPELEAEVDDDSAELVDERDVIVAAVQAATRLSRLPRSDAPWQLPLPAQIDLQDIGADSSSASAVVGLVDEPERQWQGPFSVDLEAGHVCVAGGGNSGKSTALLAIAEAFAASRSPDKLHIYGVDFGGGGLAPLAALPHCGGVAAQHDPAAVQWVLQALRDIVATRLAAGANADQPRILVLVDNFSGFWNAISDSEGGGQDQSAEMVRLLDIGRAAGVTFAVSLERPDTMRSTVLGMMTTRLMLPSTDSEAYAAFGLTKFKQGTEPSPGRAIVRDRTPHEMQFGWPSRLLDGGYEWPAGEHRPLPISPLPTQIEHRELATLAASLPQGQMLLGLRDGTNPLFVRPIEDHLLVLGSRRSGRSNALAVALGELRRNGVAEVLVFNPRRSQVLRDAVGGGTEGLAYAERAEDIEQLFGHLVSRYREALNAYASGGELISRWAVVTDDADVVDIPPDAGDALQALVLRGADLGTTLVAAADCQALRMSYPAGIMRALLNQRAGILLNPQTSEDFDLLGARGRPAPLPSGRGWWCEGGGKTAVQLGLV